MRNLALALILVVLIAGCVGTPTEGTTTTTQQTPGRGVTPVEVHTSIPSITGEPTSPILTLTKEELPQELLIQKFVGAASKQSNPEWEWFKGKPFLNASYGEFTRYKLNITTEVINPYVHLGIFPNHLLAKEEFNANYNICANNPGAVKVNIGDGAEAVKYKSGMGPYLCFINGDIFVEISVNNMNADFKSLEDYARLQNEKINRIRIPTTTTTTKPSAPTGPVHKLSTYELAFDELPKYWDCDYRTKKPINSTLDFSFSEVVPSEGVAIECGTVRFLNETLRSFRVAAGIIGFSDSNKASTFLSDSKNQDKKDGNYLSDINLGEEAYSSEGGIAVRSRNFVVQIAAVEGRYGAGEVARDFLVEYAENLLKKWGGTPVKRTIDITALQPPSTLGFKVSQKDAVDDYGLCIYRDFLKTTPNKYDRDKTADIASVDSFSDGQIVTITIKTTGMPAVKSGWTIKFDFAGKNENAQDAYVRTCGLSFDPLDVYSQDSYMSSCNILDTKRFRELMTANGKDITGGAYDSVEKVYGTEVTYRAKEEYRKNYGDTSVAFSGNTLTIKIPVAYLSTYYDSKDETVKPSKVFGLKVIVPSRGENFGGEVVQDVAPNVICNSENMSSKHIRPFLWGQLS